uniref:Peptidase M20 n=1 Tax=Thermosporothrix sp. COM3 TaxID=2490863 RepID=A0A455SW20_9CHLR|nr:peptidase M20 [Thermosporothrix sp. COM3]
MSLTESQLEHIRSRAQAYLEQVVETGIQICTIPAPTGAEGKRAEFVASLFRERGYEPEIDALQNVYVRRKGRHPGPIVMLLAHLDTVFPAETSLNVVREGDILRGPGIGDNSLSVASLLATLDMLDELKLETEGDLLFVADVGEEGLGNLCGARTAVDRFRETLGAVLVIDGSLGYVVHEAVGSKRWRITVKGPGGHSYGAFGTASAIHGLAHLIVGITSLEIPEEPKTTYNVGVIEGGTSVNTIAAEASALLDMRSTDPAALQALADQVQAIVKRTAKDGLQTEITVLGERPAGRRERTDPLVQLAASTLRWLGMEPRFTSSSTDANIPISYGIPAVCVGVTQGHKAHTVEEWVTISPLGTGLAQVVRLAIEASSLVKK